MKEQKKESVEIECPQCKVRFRLWVPADVFSKWRNGEEIGCIICRAKIKLEKSNDGFHVASGEPLEELVEALPKDVAGEGILIVDDDAVIRKMAEDALRKNKFQPINAKNGIEAFNLLEKSRVAAVVVDLHLKNPKDPQSIMDGEEFLRKLADSGRSIPAIVTTGRDLIDDIILEPKWYNLQVKAFIQKGSPFWVDELIARLKEIFKRD